MSNVDLWFYGILRFTGVAFVLLTIALCGVRLLKQPLERVRLVQVSLLTLLVISIIATAKLVPTIDLALLPPEPVATTPSPTIQPQVAIESQPVMTVNEGSRSSEPIGLQSSSQLSAVDETTVPNSTSATMTPPASGFDWSWFRLSLVGLFLAVSVLNLAYLVIGFAATRRIVAESQPLSDAMAARIREIVGLNERLSGVRLVSSSRVRVPMVSGVWHPTVILPQGQLEPDAKEVDLKHSITHELGHVERFDVLTWQLVSLCQTVLWIQPCYWLLKRELRVAQDQLADEYATQHASDHAAYATTLLELSRARQRVLPGALTMTGGKSNLHRRIEMLLNEKFRLVAARKHVILGFALMIGLGGVALVSLRPIAVSAAPPALEAGEPEDASKEASNEDAATDAPAESAEHTGMVVDVDTNEPIEGATVTVTRMNSSDWRELAVTESTTDASGKYTFTIPPDQLSQRLLYIMFDVDHPEFAGRHCGSYGYGMIVENLKNGEQPWFSKLKMVRGQKVSGRLVDENGQPVADAQLRCHCAPKSGFDRVRSSILDGLSDSDGNFEFVVPHDGEAKLSVIPRDHAMKYVALGEKRGDIGEVELAEGFEIQGVVRDATGKPMSGLWVNLTPEDDRREASYEMKRSCKTDSNGEFRSRPLKPGKYQVEVELKATGALEKLKYANFHDTPTPAMFVPQPINVTQDNANEPFVIQAVPHVLISLDYYKPDGEISGGHSPHMFGSFDGQRMFIRGGKKKSKGAYELMVPHGFEDVEIRFTTNEHSALKVQFPGEELVPQDSFRFDRLEADIEGIRVVRYRAAILKVKITDENGDHLKDARIHATFPLEEGADDRMMMGRQIGYNREGDLFRLSSILPGTEVTVTASMKGYEEKTEKVTMEAEERRTITIELKKETAAEESTSQPSE